ncbi:MAG TPA: hypothetical protein PKI81_12065, partial [bacterium]|nr:hypothetical protein [bacterium]
LTLTVYNMLGQKIREFRMEEQGGRSMLFRWDGTDERGQPAGSGLYVVVLRGPGIYRTVKLVLMK